MQQHQNHLQWQFHQYRVHKVYQIRFECAFFLHLTLYDLTCMLILRILFYSMFQINKFINLQLLFVSTTQRPMAKKHKNIKLAEGSFANKQKKTSPFGAFANKLADAKKKKAEKMTDTQKRLIDSKRNNKMMKVSKKAKKFGLLDDEENMHDGPGLTHRGMPLKQMDEFNDMEFDSQMMQNDEQFEAAHDNLNFTGFQQEEQPKQNNGQDRPKSKNQVYKQIIQKSKAYKMFRQQIYEQNLNVATQLDQQFHDFVGNLKFRNNDRKVKERIQGRDLQYDRLMNQLKEDQRVVSNKVVQKNQKYTEKIRKKKSDQLNKIMKDGSEDQNDIRGWIQDVNNQNDSNEQAEQQDELDDVQLSSGDQQDDEEQEEEDENGDQDQQIQALEQEVSKQADNEQEEDDEHEREDDDEDEQDSPVIVNIKKSSNKIVQKTKPIQKTVKNKANNASANRNKLAKNKQRKLNKIE